MTVVDSPDLQRQCPPRCGPRAPPGRCRGTAAPRRPARCTSCSRTLPQETQTGVSAALYHHPPQARSRDRGATFGGVVVSDLADGVPHDLLVVHRGAGGDLTGQEDHPSFGNRLCRGESTTTTTTVLSSPFSTHSLTTQRPSAKDLSILEVWGGLLLIG